MFSIIAVVEKCAIVVSDRKNNCGEGRYRLTKLSTYRFFFFSLARSYRSMKLQFCQKTARETVSATSGEDFSSRLSN